jgi:signal transduction histidine kinase
VTLWLAIAGWALVTGLAIQAARMARKLELVARADHELRGPVTALRLAVEALGRRPHERRRADALGVHLDRLELGLADLAAARAARQAPARPSEVPVEALARAAAAAYEPAAREAGREGRVDWRAGFVLARADRSRLSQALGKRARQRRRARRREDRGERRA